MPLLISLILTNVNIIQTIPRIDSRHTDIHNYFYIIAMRTTLSIYIDILTQQISKYRMENLSFIYCYTHNFNTVRKLDENQIMRSYEYKNEYITTPKYDDKYFLIIRRGKYTAKHTFLVIVYNLF